MNTTFHRIRVLASVVGAALAMLVAGATSALADAAPFDQHTEGPPLTTAPAGDQLWTATSISLTALAVLAVVALVGVLAVHVGRRHGSRVPAAA